MPRRWREAWRASHAFSAWQPLAIGQVTNVASLARDGGVARPTVQGYFEVLSDTLLGSWLPAWQARARVQEVAHPKCYLFDTGVVRALAGRLREPLDGTERGFLLRESGSDWGFVRETPV